MAELGRRFARRDPEAFEALFHHLRDAVYVIGFLELADADEAQDLVQETFRRAWAAADSLSDPQRIRPWLFAIARNLCVDLGKKGARRPALVDDVALRRTVEDAGGQPGEVAERRELTDRIRTLLSAVPERFREILALRLLQERSYAEIAVAQGVPVHAVKNAVARGGAILYEKIRNTPSLRPDGLRDGEERA